jgi:preprotein translocase subunit SecD
MQNRLAALIVVLFLTVPVLACSTELKQSLKWHLTLEIDPSVPDRAALVRETVEVLNSRLNRLAIGNYSVQVVGELEAGRIRVNLAEVADRERLKKYLTSQGLLQLVHIVSDPSPAPTTTYATKDEALAALIKTTNSGAKPLPYMEESTGLTNDAKSMRWVLAEFPPVIEGEDVRSATAVPGFIREGEYEVQFTLKPAAAAKFGIWTASNLRQYLGVVLNNEVRSIAYIRSQITDTGKIRGRFAKLWAEDLARILISGPLPAPVKIVEEGEN